MKNITVPLRDAPSDQNRRKHDVEADAQSLNPRSESVTAAPHSLAYPLSPARPGPAPQLSRSGDSGTPRRQRQHGSAAAPASCKRPALPAGRRGQRELGRGAACGAQPAGAQGGAGAFCRDAATASSGAAGAGTAAHRKRFKRDAEGRPAREQRGRVRLASFVSGRRATLPPRRPQRAATSAKSAPPRRGLRRTAAQARGGRPEASAEAARGPPPAPPVAGPARRGPAPCCPSPLRTTSTSRLGSTCSGRCRDGSGKGAGRSAAGTRPATEPPAEG